MSSTPYQNADTDMLNKLEIAVLDGNAGRDSTAEVKIGQGLSGQDDDNDETDREPPVSLDLSIRRGRLALITVLAVASISVATFFVNRGFEVHHFNGNDKNATQREKMLDDYNSYSANIASAFGKPVESFITIAVQIIVLHFMISSMTKPELGWKVGAVTVALGAAIGYLINNGFNAVNVQLRSSEIELVISASDLSTQSPDNASFSDTAESMSTTTELAAKNPITNTILRNIVRTREPKAPSRCNRFYGQTTNFAGGVPDTTVDFGFAQRDWQSRLLEEAVTPKQVRFVANATDKSVNNNARAEDLPMNASLAADLFLYMLEIGKKRLDWGMSSSGRAYDNATVLAARYTGKEGPASAAGMAGLLPSGKQPTVSETEQRKWVVREIQARLPRAINQASAVANDIPLEFSHVDVTPSIQFDALTIELEVNPLLISNATSSGRKLQLRPTDECGPWPALCVLKKALLKPSISYEITYDTHTQIFAVGSCVDTKGKETLTSFWGSDNRINTLECDAASNTSMIVVSIGKRLVADAIQQNASFNSNGTFVQNGTAVVKNLRKIYSLTVGRLSWKPVDLASEFGATCTAGAGACDGIQVTLSPPLNTAPGVTPTEQRLIAGASSLPVSRLPLVYNFFNWEFSTQPLVELKELARTPQAESYSQLRAAGGDPLFLHNVKSVNWDKTVLPVMNNSAFIDEVTLDTCRVQVEDRLYLAIKNHMYMEHSLQPAYTAATFFLLQDGVVKDTIKASKTAISLNFDKNVETMALFVSIPDRNAWLTFGGCIVLVILLGYVLVLSSCKKGASNGTSLGKIDEPHAIARVMLDEAQYPPAVLHRRVVRQDDTVKDPRQLDEFMINGISLQAQNDLDRQNSTKV